jgi:hypothetical protein
MDAPLITSLVAAITGAGGAYWTVRTYFLKRQDELAERQRQALERANAEIERQKVERQIEMDRYAEGKTKAYAAERDFGHLMRQYDSLNNNLNVLHEFQEKRVADIEDDLRVIKGMLQMLLVQLGTTDTAVMRHLKKDE